MMGFDMILRPPSRSLKRKHSESEILSHIEAWETENFQSLELWRLGWDGFDDQRFLISA